MNAASPHIVFASLAPGQLSGWGWMAAAGAVALAAAVTWRGLRSRRASDRLMASLEKARVTVPPVHVEDSLTGLQSRSSFEDRLGIATAASARVSGCYAVMYIDLDNFKPINDALGHGVGDTVLREMAERLRLLASTPDDVARVGGDEFVLLLEGNPDKVVAAQMATRILATIARPVGTEERSPVVTCSIGIVFFPDDGAQSRLIAHANAAMNAAKRLGGSTYCFFDPAMDAGARELVELLRDLRRALDRDQLELYYQPKVDAHDGRITGVEALLRWHHPARGLVSPTVFVPLAERFGMIGALGQWALEEAMRQIGAWHARGLQMRVAVNLSLHQLRDRDLAHRIADGLRRHSIEPHLLSLEITESVAMADTRSAQRAFRRLRAVGIQLSIDDFGTGYSSLSYLRKLPVHELKIDRSFVQDLDESTGSRAIVSAVVTLAHALGLRVVAEGVESESQRDALRELGCDQLQGYLFAKPMSASSLLAWARATTPSPLEFKPSLFADTEPVDRRGSLQ